MPNSAGDPLGFQRQVIQFTLKLQQSGEVTDRALADRLEADLVTLQTHIEMLAAEDRIDVARSDAGYVLQVTPEQQARHEAPPPHVVLQQRIERAGAMLGTVLAAIQTIARWMPVVLTVAGAAAGWFLAGTQDRVTRAFVGGVVGLIAGIMCRREPGR